MRTSINVLAGFIFLFCFCFFSSCKDEHSGPSDAVKKRMDSIKNECKLVAGYDFDAMVKYYEANGGKALPVEKVSYDFKSLQDFIVKYQGDKDFKVVTAIAEFDKAAATKYVADWNIEYPTYPIKIDDVINHLTIIIGLVYYDETEPFVYRLMPKICPPPPGCGPDFTTPPPAER